MNIENNTQTGSPDNPVTHPDVPDNPNPTEPEGMPDPPDAPNPYPVNDPPIDTGTEPVPNPDPGPRFPEPIPGAPPEVVFK